MMKALSKQEEEAMEFLNKDTLANITMVYNLMLILMIKFSESTVLMLKYKRSTVLMNK